MATRSSRKAPRPSAEPPTTPTRIPTDLVEKARGIAEKTGAGIHGELSTAEILAMAIRAGLPAAERAALGGRG